MWSRRLGRRGLALLTVGVAAAVGARVGDSWPQAMDRARIRPNRRLLGVAQRDGKDIAAGSLATDWGGLLFPEHRDMRIPPNTSSNRK